MSDPLVDQANAISDKSPAIKRFALTSAARTIALEQTVAALTPPVVPPVTPPATTRRHVGNGYILFREGNQWAGGDPALYNSRYGAVIVGYGNDFDAGQLSGALGFSYRTAVEVEDTTNISDSQFGVSLAQATTAGAVLHDGSGTALHPSPGVYAGDIGNPAFQKVWVQNELARLAKENEHAVFIDNVVPACWFGTPAGMYGGLSFADAYVSFVQYVAVNMPGVYVIANSGPGGAGWASRIAPYVSTLLEGYTGTAAQQAFLQATQTAGGDAFALITNTDPASPLARQYALAFHAVWNRAGGGLGVDYGAPDPWNDNWTTAV